MAGIGQFGTGGLIEMPGTKWKRSLKKPKTYKALRRKGLSKTRAAKISNAQARKSRRRRRK